MCEVDGYHSGRRQTSKPPLLREGIHMNAVTKPVSSPSSRGVRFSYVRDRRIKELHSRKNGRLSRGAPIACVASWIDVENNRIEVAFSAANLREDGFKYSLARELALGRLALHPIRIYFEDGELPVRGMGIMRAIMTALANQENLPGRMKREVERYLRTMPLEDPSEVLVPEQLLGSQPPHRANQQLVPVRRTPRYPVETKEVGQ